LEFLKYLQQHQQSFGSTFFVVNQRTVNTYPSTLLIAINRHGFQILDPAKKVKQISFRLEVFSELLFAGNPKSLWLR